MKAEIIEIFSSIQGEGLWVGRPQVFVRFRGCKLKCLYCDTPLTHSKIKQSRIESPPFSKRFEAHALEWTPEELNQTIERFRIPSLAITGGEPLEHGEYLGEWFESLKGRYQLLLETSGVEVEALKKVVSYLNMISLDVKVPSATGEGAFWETHHEFIQVAKEKPCYAKVTYNEKITDDEIENLMSLLKKNPELTMFFQPVSPIQKRDLRTLLDVFQLFAERYATRVRFLPQMHKFLSIL